MKLLKHILILLTLSLLVPAAPAGTFSINAWTGDASSGIASGQTLWAYHFGVTNIATVNGVTVPGIGTNGNPAVVGQFAVAGIPFVFLNDNNNLTSLGGSGSAVMAKNFLYGGAPGLLTVQGLTTGQVYTISIYGVGREAPPTTRASNFTNGTDHVYVDENALGLGHGVRVDYTFTATAATNLTIVMPTNTSTFHTYALALRQPFLVTTTSDAGPGSLRQAVLDAATLAGTNAITFAPTLAGATITLASEITITSDVTMDASDLAGGLTVSGGSVTRIFTVNSGRTVALRGLTLAHGQASGDLGGALYNGGVMTIDYCTLKGNEAAYGGAIDNGGKLTINNTTLNNNTASSYGGAIFNDDTMEANNCTMTDNEAVIGGGVISDNSGNESFSFSHCTIVGNRCLAANGGGGFDMVKASSVTIGDTVLAGNTADGTVVNYGTSSVPPPLVSTGYNLSDDAPSGLTGTGDLVNSANIKLSALGYYGGPTQTMPPLPGSPAIDAANVIAGLSTDQRGSARVVGSAPDIGAVESGGLWVQNNLNSGANSLRDIVASTASITNSKTILFITNLSGATITLTSEIMLTNNVTIDASSLPSGVTVSGGNATRIFFAGGPTVSLHGLTLTGGNAIGDVGGAIFNNLGDSLHVTRCTFFGNTSSSDGGAIGNNSGTITMSQCTLSSNQAPGFGGAIESLGSLTLTHCTVAGNVGNVGGGIDNYAGTLTLEDTIVAGNTAGTGADINNDTATFVRNGTNLVQGIVNAGGVTQSGPTPINAAPLLAPLGNYGGLTQTMPPLPGSPAINAAGASSFASDQRGYPCPVGLAADIGAVEGIYIAAGPGKITGITQLGNGSVRLSFTNLTDASFPVIATTNLSQSVANWPVVGYASETAAGTNLLQFTDPDAAKYPQRFYRVQSP